MSEMQKRDRPKFPAKELITAGPNAAKVLVRHTVETSGRDIHERIRRHRAADDFKVEEYVDRLIKSQLALARAEGAGAGAVTTAAEMSSVITGPAAVAAIGTSVLADMAALAAIQVRLSLMIAAAYGHDMGDIETRASEILSLHSLEFGAAKAGAPAAARAGQRVGKRLLEKSCGVPSFSPSSRYFAWWASSSAAPHLYAGCHSSTSPPTPRWRT